MGRKLETQGRVEFRSTGGLRSPLAGGGQRLFYEGLTGWMRLTPVPEGNLLYAKPTNVFNRCQPHPKIRHHRNILTRYLGTWPSQADT